VFGNLDFVVEAFAAVGFKNSDSFFNCVLFVLREGRAVNLQGLGGVYCDFVKRFFEAGYDGF